MDELLQAAQARVAPTAAHWIDDAIADWIWCTWLGPCSLAPKSFFGRRANVDWAIPPWRELGAELRERLHSEPDRDLRTHFDQLLRERALLPTEANR